MEHYQTAQWHKRFPRMNGRYENRICNKPENRDNGKNNYNISSSLCRRPQLPQIQDPLTIKFSNSIQEFYQVQERFNHPRCNIDYSNDSVRPQTHRRDLILHQVYNVNAAQTHNNINRHNHVNPNNQAHNFSRSLQYYSDQRIRYKGIVSQHGQFNISSESNYHPHLDNTLTYYNRHQIRSHVPRYSHHYPSSKQQHFIPGSTFLQLSNKNHGNNRKLLDKKDFEADWKLNRQHSDDFSHSASQSRCKQENSRPKEALFRPNFDNKKYPNLSMKSLEKYEQHLKIRSVKNLTDNRTADKDVRTDTVKLAKNQGSTSTNNVICTHLQTVKSSIEKYEKHLKIKTVQNQENSKSDLPKEKWNSHKGWKTPSKFNSCKKDVLNNENKHQQDQYLQQSLSDCKEIHGDQKEIYNSLQSLEQVEDASSKTRNLSEKNRSMIAAKLQKFKVAKSESKQVISPTWSSPLLGVKKVDNKPPETCDTLLKCSGRSRPMVKSGKCHRELFHDKNNENIPKTSPESNPEKHKIDGIDPKGFYKKQRISKNMTQAEKCHQFNIDKYLRKSFRGIDNEGLSSSKTKLSSWNKQEKKLCRNMTKERKINERHLEKSIDDNSRKPKLGKSSNVKFPEPLLQSRMKRTNSKYKTLEISSEKADEKLHKYNTKQCQVMVEDISKVMDNKLGLTSKRRKRKLQQNSSFSEITCKFAKTVSNPSKKNVLFRKSRRRNSNSKIYSDSETSQLVSVKLTDQQLSKSVHKGKTDENVLDNMVPAPRKRGRLKKNPSKDVNGGIVGGTKSNINSQEIESICNGQSSCCSTVEPPQKKITKTRSSEDMRDDNEVTRPKKVCKSDNDKSGLFHLPRNIFKKFGDKEDKQSSMAVKVSPRVNGLNKKRKIKDSKLKEKKVHEIEVDGIEKISDSENKSSCREDGKSNENCKGISPAVSVIENILPDSSKDKSTLKANDCYTSLKNEGKHFVSPKKKILKSKMKSVENKPFKRYHKNSVIETCDDQKLIQKNKPTIIVTNEKLVLGRIKSCLYCKKYHTRIGDLLKQHIQFDHPFKCHVCRLTFADKEEMFKHKHVKPYHYCKLCQREFINERNYDRHKKSSQHQRYIRVQRQLLESILNSYTKKGMTANIPDLSEFSDLVTFPDIKPFINNPSSYNTTESETQAESIEKFYHESSEIQDLLSMVETKIKLLSNQKTNEKHAPDNTTANFSLKNTAEKANGRESPTTESNDLKSEDLKHNKETEKYVADINKRTDVVECEEPPSLYSNQFLVNNNETQFRNNSFEHFDVDELPPLVPRVVKTSFDINSSVYKDYESGRYSDIETFNREYETGPCSFLYDDTKFGLSSEFPYNAHSDSCQSWTNSYIELAPLNSCAKTQFINGIDQINKGHTQTKNFINLDANRYCEIASLESPNMMNFSTCDMMNVKPSTVDMLQSFSVQTSMEQSGYAGSTFTELLSFAHETDINDSTCNSPTSLSNHYSLIPLTYQANQFSVEGVHYENSEELKEKIPEAELSSSTEIEATYKKENQDYNVCGGNNAQDIVEGIPVSKHSATEENPKKITQDQRKLLDNLHSASCIKKEQLEILSEINSQTSAVDKVSTTASSSTSSPEKPSSEHVILDSDADKLCTTTVSEQNDVSVTMSELKEKVAYMVENKSGSLEGTSSGFTSDGDKLLTNLVIDLEACDKPAGSSEQPSDTSALEVKCQ